MGGGGYKRRSAPPLSSGHTAIRSEKPGASEELQVPPERFPSDRLMLPLKSSPAPWPVSSFLIPPALLKQQKFLRHFSVRCSSV